MADAPRGEALLPTAALHDWMVDFWLAAGSNEREALLTADHLVAANLAGHDSHGVGMAPRYLKALLAGELQLNQTIEVLRDHGTMLAVDGRHGVGQSVAHQAMELCIARALEHGVCVMGLRRSHHLGRVGHWAEQAIARGLVSIHFTNAVAAPPMVAPFGGLRARFLTNPFTVGIPRPGGEPIVVDFATSAVAHGKARVAYNKGVKLPPGCLIDAQGRPTDDPAVMFEPADGPRGALLPFAAHKGYALAVACELLGAALLGGETAQPQHLDLQHAIWNGMLTIAFDPARLGDEQIFGGAAAGFIEWVQSAGAAGDVLMPGDPEREMRRRRARMMPIDKGTLAQLDEAAADLRRARGNGPAALSTLARPP